MAHIFVDHFLLLDINCKGHCLIKSNISIPKKVINRYISYIPGRQLETLSTYFTLVSCLLGSLKLTKNADSDKYKYTGYHIGFDSRLEFFIQMKTMEKNGIVFGADMGLSVHVDIKGKDILILGEGNTRIR